MPLSLFSPLPMAEPTAAVSLRRPPLVVPMHRSSVRLFSRISVNLQYRRYNGEKSGSLVLRNGYGGGVVRALAGNGEAEVSVSAVENEYEDEEEELEEEEEEEEEEIEPTPEDMKNINEIKRVLKILQEKRDMTFGEVKLTIMIEDPRDIERKRLLGIEDPEEITRDDLADALVDVNEGRIPRNRDMLALLATEMSEWPDLDVEIEKKKSKPGRSLYARITNTGVDPEEAAKRLNMDWDSAADIQSGDEDDENDVPPAVGYGALYLVTGFPILIGVSVVLILFFNSLQ